MFDLHKQITELRAAGFTVGDRDPRLNTDYKGRYMVAEPYDENELPTKDGSNGPWCIVGDDLAELVKEGHQFLTQLREL